MSQVQTATIEDHFVGKAKSVRSIYDHILRCARRFGPVEEQPKKTSIHLARRSAFAGVATQKDALILTIKSDVRIDDPRVRRAEQTSANRWHFEVRMTTPAEVDERVQAWLETAYALAG